jgi:cytochrome c biogenesis protein
MVPVELDGQRVFLFGVRDTLDASFRYLRVPADAKDSPDEWLRVRAALADPALRSAAAARYASKAAPSDNPKLAEQLKASAERAINLFAGAERPVREGAETPDADASAGLGALQTFVMGNVPEADRNRTADVLVRILNGSLFELTNLVREQAGGKALEPNETTQKYMGQTVLSLSESFAYPAPLVFTLKDFEQVQASVFQVSRAPGKTLVYLGCVLLIIGVFAMLYIRERRLWIWLQASPTDARTAVTMALSATRQTMDNDREFDTLKLLVAPAASAAQSAPSSS